MTLIRLLLATCTAALALTTAGVSASPPYQATAQPAAEKLELTAFAVNMPNLGPIGNQVIEISIHSWSSDAERAGLLATVTDKGTDALLIELQKQPVHGRFRLPGLVGDDPWQLRKGRDLHYAWQTMQADGGRRIVFATDRFIPFEEAAKPMSKSLDYPFTVFELLIAKNGEGSGKVAAGAKILFDKKKNALEIQNSAKEPVRLQNVKMTVVK